MPSKNAPDPILLEDDRRFVVLPVRYPVLWNLYKKACASFWVPEELELKSDVMDWQQVLTVGERHAISRVLAFFATADGIVSENLVERFAQDVQIPEARFFYGFQIAMENIHAETYAILLETLIKDCKERADLVDASRSVPSIARKNDWAMKWIHGPDRSFEERLIAFACVEGIFFSSSFALIFWMKSRGLMPGLAQSNEFIARDEGLHTQFACTLLHHLNSKPAPEVATAIIQEAVECEIEFAKETLSKSVIGLTAIDMATYVHFVADQLLQSLGYEPTYHVKNPLPFMKTIGMPSRTNFFERQNTEYRSPTSNLGLGLAEEFFPPGSFA